MAVFFKIQEPYSFILLVSMTLSVMERDRIQ